MLNMRGVGPSALDEAVQKRFSGEYVVPTDPDKATDAPEEEP